MDISPALKKDRGLTQESFDKLLNCLNRDRALAAEGYERIRRKLITFFESRGCYRAEELTDTTINRVARRLIEGIDLYTADPVNFFFGVARKVLQEYWDYETRKNASVDLPGPPSEPSQDPRIMAEQQADRLVYEQKIACLEKCLDQLPPKNRELIIQYYYSESKTKIQNRKRLAEELGIQLNAVRIRALRIREKLESCVTSCLKQITAV